MKYEANKLLAEKAQAEQELENIQQKIRNTPFENGQAYKNELGSALLRNSFKFAEQTFGRRSEINREMASRKSFQLPLQYDLSPPEQRYKSPPPLSHSLDANPDFNNLEGDSKLVSIERTKEEGFDMGNHQPVYKAHKEYALTPRKRIGGGGGEIEEGGVINEAGVEQEQE